MIALPGGLQQRSARVLQRLMHAFWKFDAAVETDRAARRTAIVVGAVFVVASLPKFLAFSWEREQFVRFELPYPTVWVLAAGVFELAGGIALLRRQGIAPALALLIPTMLVAIVASGVLQGDVVPSLTVAPLLLGAMAFLLVRSRP